MKMRNRFLNYPKRQIDPLFGELMCESIANCCIWLYGDIALITNGASLYSEICNKTIYHLKNKQITKLEYIIHTQM